MYEITTDGKFVIGTIIYRKDYDGWVGCTQNAGNEFAPRNASAYKTEATAKAAIERRGYIVREVLK